MDLLEILTLVVMKTLCTGSLETLILISLRHQQGDLWDSLSWVVMFVYLLPNRKNVVVSGVILNRLFWLRSCDWTERKQQLLNAQARWCVCDRALVFSVRSNSSRQWEGQEDESDHRKTFSAEMVAGFSVSWSSSVMRSKSIRAEGGAAAASGVARSQASV